MRKQILSGFMMFALVAGSLAPAGEVRAEEFQVVDSDNAPVYNEAKDQFETKVELTGVNAGKFRFQKDGGNWLETTKNSAVFGVEPIGISLYRCAYTENNSSEEKEWRLINVSYIDNGELTLNKNLSLEYFFGKLPQKENLWLDVSLAKGDEKYLDKVKKLAEGLVRSGVPEHLSWGYWGSKCLCCGGPGVLEYFADLYDLTGDEKYKKYAKRTADKLISDSYEEKKGRSFYGAWDRIDPARVVSYTGYYIGAAGAAGALLKYYSVLKNIKIADFFEYYL